MKNYKDSKKFCTYCFIKALLASVLYFSILLGGLMLLINLDKHQNKKLVENPGLCYGEVYALEEDKRCLKNVFSIIKFRPPYENEIIDNYYVNVEELTEKECLKILTNKNHWVIIEGDYATEVYTDDNAYLIENWFCYKDNGVMNG